MRIGQIVIFTGCSKEQEQWGHNDSPDSLSVGNRYVISKVEEHSWHTKIMLEGIDGCFNSVCFDEVS